MGGGPAAAAAARIVPSASQRIVGTVGSRELSWTGDGPGSLSLSLCSAVKFLEKHLYTHSVSLFFRTFGALSLPRIITFFSLALARSESREYII